MLANMIAIIDYGMGNLRSVQKGCQKMGYPAEITREAACIEAADGVILPGVGAFGACMKGLAECGLIDTVYRIVEKEKPLLGICVGMQILFSESVEFGRVKGLDILKGTIERFEPDAFSSVLTVPTDSTDNEPLHKIPHMGWNQLHIRQPAPHLTDISENAAVYFVHSYYPIPADPAIIATTTDHRITFASSVWSGNIFATQFHPEKSQATGLRILANFGQFSIDQRRHH